MGVLSDAAVSRGDVMREIAELKARLDRVETARRLESAAVGAGGLRLRGGRLLAEDAGGGRVFEVTTDPASIFMRPELVQNVVEAILTSPAGRALAAGIFADRVSVATASGIVSTGSSTFVSLSGGPTATEVEVTAGVMLIFIDANIGVNTFNLSESTGEISPHITGATTVNAGSLGQKRLELRRGSNNYDTIIHERSASLFIATGLNSGTHTVEARYRAFVSGGGVNPQFSARNLAVIAL